MASRSDNRQKVIQAAADLLRNHGRTAVTTRAVSTAAEVQPPTIYRLFGDMNGLLDAVAADGFTRYLARKTAQPASSDPVEDLRDGWNLHVGFGVENPAHYLLMYGDPLPGGSGETTRESRRILLTLVHRVAEAGRLVVGVEQAADMVHAAGMGVTLSLIRADPDRRDLSLSARTREAVIAAITSAPSPDDGPVGGVAAGTGSGPGGDREPARRAIALRSVLDRSEAEFSDGERILLGELLTRLADTDPRAHGL
ncbi:TetR family transcriptional regulator [Nocardiopsis synnemataformans]|uniref:TetR/AcrR family transcriptional regulator n=1 Tax=Nocardiopsis synnemataformans TaxID=61305 RepID=UPI003EBDABF1